MSAPFVGSTTPSLNASNVYLNQKVIITFDQSIDPTSVTDNSIVLYRVSDFNIEEKVFEWDSSFTTLTITPDIVFDQNTQYNVVVVGIDSSPNCVKSSGAENLYPTYSWYFTTGTAVYQPPVDVDPVILPEAPLGSPAAFPVPATTASSTFSIINTYPENYAANIGTINGDLSSVHFSGPITIKFNAPVASGVSVQQSWVTLTSDSVDGDPSTPVTLPSGVLSNVNGDTLYWTPSTYNGNDYSWAVNNEIIVTVSSGVKSGSGSSLGNDYRFMFTTAYRPYYCTIPKIRSVIGSFIREIPDDTIARNIYLNSIEVYNIANTIYSQFKWSIDSPPFAAIMWVCCKTQYDLLYARLLDMASSGPGTIKRLGDFTIQESTDIQAGIKGALQKAEDCLNAWMKLILGKYRRAKARMAVKGVTSPATPPMRGARTWTLETGRDTLGANKTLQRRIKSPGIYSSWS